MEACIVRIVQKSSNKAHSRAHQPYSGTNDSGFKQNGVRLMRIKVPHSQPERTGAAHHDLTKVKTFRVFLWIYNIGVPLTAVMMLIRGVFQVLEISLSAAASASVSGIAGIGHVLTGAGLILLLLSLKKIAKN